MSKRSGAVSSGTVGLCAARLRVIVTADAERAFTDTRHTRPVRAARGFIPVATLALAGLIITRTAGAAWEVVADAFKAHRAIGIGGAVLAIVSATDAYRPTMSALRP